MIIEIDENLLRIRDKKKVYTLFRLYKDGKRMARDLTKTKAEHIAKILLEYSTK